jgi:glycosyltransferase involved in cell wall biosynthesis
VQIKRILFFYQNSDDTIFLRSIIDLYSKSNIVHLITLSPTGFLHNHYHSTDIKVNSINNFKSSFSILIYLICYCYKHNIDFVFSHLQRANLIAVIAQFFIKAKVYPTRHHIDDVRLSNNKNSRLQDKFINFLTRKIIVLSEVAKKDLIYSENVNPKKIEILPLAYDFELYHSIIKSYDKSNVKAQSSNIISVIGRVNDNKRTELAIEVLKKMLDLGHDYLLYIVGDGPNLDKLKILSKQYNIEEKVIFTGNVSNVFDYIIKSKIILLPSISESSNQVLKESGLCSKPIILCENVGDFEEYIINHKNAFAISKNDYVNQARDIIISMDQEKLNKIGNELKITILNRFSITNLKDRYLNLIN